MVHLLEMLVGERSKGSAPRFPSIAYRFFRHTPFTHHLVTPREHAHLAHGVRPGCRVAFRFRERRYVGFVNRITRRATVLVENREGDLYTDGRRYKKFSVPLTLLEPA